ncbi:hypothetical protein ACWDBW_31895 [Streptomyces sp. NPDC001107]
MVRPTNEVLKRQAATEEAKAKKDAGILPKGPDAQHPDAADLKGRDWLTHRGATPKASTRLRASAV